jgi:endo-1,4-beta-xylanase
MLSRRSFLATLAAASAAPALAADEAGLRRKAERKGLHYGCCLAGGHLTDTAYVQAVARESGMIVPEWEAKRGRIEQRRGVYDFTAADRLAGFAEAHDMEFRAHAMVWHVSNPAWLEAALAEAKPSERLLTDYVAKAGAHFRERVHSWDVVNEALEPADGRPDGLRASRWLTAFGPGYIDTAFHAARAADSGALMVYNDYGLETADPWQVQRQKAVLGLLEGMRVRGTPCDALGIQAHLKAYGAAFDQSAFRRFLGEVAGMGYRIVISEFDVDDRGTGTPNQPAVRDQAVADLARRFLDAAFDVPQTLGLVTWGLSDRYTWLATRPWSPAESLSRARPLPLDAQLRKKPLWHAIAAAFDAAPARPRG